MFYRIEITDTYQRRVIKFFKKHKDLLGKYEKVIYLLEADPFYPSLRLHQLKGRLYPLYSVSIDMQYRITMEFYLEDKKIIPVDIGTHDDVY